MKVAMLGMALLTLGLTPVALGDARTIYRCDSNSAVTYSDRPCAADAAVHENDSSRVTVYAAPSTSASAPSRSSKPATHKTKSARSEERRVGKEYRSRGA